MRSVVEELLDKIAAEARGGTPPDPGRVRSRSRGPRSVARADLGMVLFSEREAIDALWKAADAAVRAGAAAGLAGPEAPALAAAVERLRPLFGPRG